jgi:hypothetical protein
MKRHVACLLDITCSEVSIGENDRNKEVASREVSRSAQAITGVLDGIACPPEVAHAVPELGG